MGFFLRRGSFGTFLSPRREKYIDSARKQGERRREQAPALRGTEGRRRDPAKKPLPPPPYVEWKNAGAQKMYLSARGGRKVPKERHQRALALWKPVWPLCFGLTEDIHGDVSKYSLRKYLRRRTLRNAAKLNPRQMRGHSCRYLLSCAATQVRHASDALPAGGAQGAGFDGWGIFPSEVYRAPHKTGYHREVVVAPTTPRVSVRWRHGCAISPPQGGGRAHQEVRSLRKKPWVSSLGGALLVLFSPRGEKST